MKVSKRVKKGYVLALAALFLLPCLSIMQVRAAREIDLNQECSLTVSVEVGGAPGSNDAYLEDFNRMSIPVSVYRVADVDITGQKYTPADAFEEMNFSEISGDSSSVTAEIWETLAEQAEAVRESREPEPAGTAEVCAADGNSGSARGKIEELTPGLYLVVPEETYNPDYMVQDRKSVV